MKDTLLHFIKARHKIWEARQFTVGTGPWTDDPILRQHKFTNVFRVLDYGSQFLLKELLEPGLDSRDALMRAFLYRHTGRWEAWEYFELMEGHYPGIDDLDLVLKHFNTYRGETKTVLQNRSAETRALGTGGFSKKVGKRSLFTSAYLVFPQSREPGVDKLETIVDLTRRLFTPGSPQDVVPRFMAADTQAERFAALKDAKGVGDFMSMQVLTDWGWAPQCGEDREDEFVVAGPGARKGAKLLAPELKPELVIREFHQGLLADPDCPVLWIRDTSDGGAVYRRPSLMDVQNCFCELSKYARYLERDSGARQRTYRPSHPGVQSAPVFPLHW